MTEQQFWKSIEEALLVQTAASEDYQPKLIKRLTKLLIDQSEDLRDATEKQRNDLLRKTFNNAGYGKYWNVVQNGFDQILTFQNEHWQNNTSENTSLGRSNTRLISLEKIQFKRFGALGKDAITELEKTFKSAAADDWTKQRLIDAIIPIGGKAGTYAGAIADSSLRGWDRTISGTKAEIAGVDKAIYDGPALRENSHPFCIENYQLEFTMEEIMGMSNGQLDPVISFGGGYNCVHRWRWLIQDILK